MVRSIFSENFRFMLAEDMRKKRCVALGQVFDYVKHKYVEVVVVVLSRHVPSSLRVVTSHKCFERKQKLVIEVFIVCFCFTSLNLLVTKPLRACRARQTGFD